MKGAVITVSDRGAAGLSMDKSGPLLVEFLRGIPAEPVFTRVVPDDPQTIRETFREAAALVGRGIVISTGGTGLSPRDNTPEAVSPLSKAFFPGVMEALRRGGRRKTPMAALSRGIACRVDEAFAVTLPGSARAVSEACEILGPLLKDMLSKKLLA